MKSDGIDLTKWAEQLDSPEGRANVEAAYRRATERLRQEPTEGTAQEEAQKRVNVATEPAVTLDKEFP